MNQFENLHGNVINLYSSHENEDGEFKIETLNENAEAFKLFVGMFNGEVEEGDMYEILEWSELERHVEEVFSYNEEFRSEEENEECRMICDEFINGVRSIGGGMLIRWNLEYDDNVCLIVGVSDMDEVVELFGIK